MIKEKFEEKIGCEISDTEFEIIQLCYNHSSHTERRFAQLWKGNSQDIIAETLRKINDNLNKYQSELRHNQDSIKRNSIELQMTRNRIELLNNKILRFVILSIKIIVIAKNYKWQLANSLTIIEL